MRIIKGKYPNGEPLYSAFPTTTKDVRKIFYVYGLDAWLVKINGQHYYILYPGPTPVFYNTGLSKVDALTCKRWLEIGKKNAPVSNNYRDHYEKFDWWGNLDQYIIKETLP